MDATPAAPPPLAAPPPPAPPPTAGYERAGFISRLTYHFVGELIAEARAGGLEDEAGALKYLPTADRAEQLAANFDAAWRGARAARPARAPAAAMWAAFWRAHSVHYVTYAAWSVLELGVVVGSPLLLRQFLDWYSAAAAGGAGAPPVWEGWAWAAALAAFSYCYTLVHHQLFFRGYRNGLRMRAAAVCAVQAKALRLSAAAAAAVSQGTLVNLVSNDVRRFEEFGIFWVFLVTGPALLVLVVLLVGLRLGFPSAVAGVATLLALIPAQALLARRIGKLRGATAAATDARVRAAAEAVAGALACKMLAWEAPMLERVARARAREAALVRRMNLIRACNMALSWAITPLVILAALGTASALNVELTVATVFYSISLLALPKLYMCDFFVHAVEAVSEVRVSMRRLAAFLALPEPPPPWRAAKGEGEEGVAADAAPGEVAIELSGADFDWHEGRAAKGFGGEGSAHGPPALEAVRVDGSGSGRTGAPASPRASGAPTLRGVRLAIRRGELVAVVGAVGAGKSSLLAALLGELRPVAGTGPAGRPAVAVRAQRVAYCAQVPFIMSGTVRDNVLFGAAHEPGRYSRALAAAALGPDLARMPAGDATEIGERGVALSGGQRARLALARAAYAGAAVVLLDDPLSAVDGRVRRSLFENCVRGALAGAAVVLVTHHTAYALRCDRVVVLRGGAVAEDGPPEALRARGVPELAAAAGAGAEGAAVDDACAEAEEAAAEGAEGGVEVADVAFVEVAAGPPLPPAPEPRRGFESRALSSIRSLASLRRPRLTPAPAAPPSAASLRRFLSRRLGPGSLSTSGKRAAPGAPLAPGRLVADEGRAAGGVPWSVYAAVAQRMGITAVALVAAALLGGQALFIYSEYWWVVLVVDPLTTQPPTNLLTDTYSPTLILADE
jgi:ABC-type multidrug transport system fused ATPase/permease subunit